MITKRRLALAVVGLGLTGLVSGFAPLPDVWEPSTERQIENISGDPKRGAYVIRTAGCIACHTDAQNGGAELAGGREFDTPYGVFRAPNITPDKETGIGGWSLAMFSDALTKGLRPDGSHYYPAFPYTSYTKMADQDVTDLKAYLDSIKPVSNEVQDHDLAFPFSVREGLGIWKALYFSDGQFQPRPEKSQAWNRGAYLVNGPGHCVECHTPRTLLGGLEAEATLEGTAKSPDGEKVPNITNHPTAGIGQWGEMDVAFLLQMGLTPDGDSVGGSMGEVVRDGTSHFTQDDIAAVSTYLLNP